MSAEPLPTTVPPLVIIIASAGRPLLLAEALGDLARQTVPAQVIVSVPDESSLPPDGLPAGVRLVHARGAAAQRNAGIAAAPEDAIVFFFDDDAVVRPDYLEEARRFFSDHPEVVGITGRVLLDGATRAEIGRDESLRAVQASADLPVTRRFERTAELYGCNFAYRRSPGIPEVFDDRLPLYSWLEDHDFARRLMRYGTLAKVDDCVIVHRGVKSGGRTAHTRLGYSQMMNPLYLLRKRSFPLWLALKEIVPRCGKNLVLSVGGPEAPWRRQRLRGNAHALADALRGRFDPERMLDF
jgi:GT2 family glycosyltransferase